MSTAQKNDLPYINAFNLIPGIGAQKLHLIDEYFEGFESAWNASKKEFEEINFSQKLIENITHAQKNLNPQKEFKKLQENNIELITKNDSKFPTKLKTIKSPPFLLYVRGNKNTLNSPSITVVGSRKISDYGKHAINSIVSDVAISGITIISGLAIGTDALAHKATLEIGGATIAVLGGGIDDKTITPRSHVNLAKQILQNSGTIVSEYPIGTQPNRGTFPARNRIMAGLADATIIIEATKKSGTLITAKHAFEFNRKLFALPGSIFAQNSLGPNMLLRDKNALPLLCSDDVKAIFKDSTVQRSAVAKKQAPTNETQKILYKTINKYPNGAQINKIIKESNLDGATVSSELTLMEIEGIIKNIGNQIYIITK